MRRKKTLWTAMVLLLCAFGLTGCQNENQNGNKMGTSTEMGTTGLTETDPVTETDLLTENTGDNGSVNSVTSGSEESSEGVLDKIGDDIRDGADQAGDDIGNSVREDAAQISEGMDGDAGTQP